MITVKFRTSTIAKLVISDLLKDNIQFAHVYPVNKQFPFIFAVNCASDRFDYYGFNRYNKRHETVFVEMK